MGRMSTWCTYSRQGSNELCVQHSRTRGIQQHACDAKTCLAQAMVNNTGNGEKGGWDKGNTGTRGAHTMS